MINTTKKQGVGALMVLGSPTLFEYQRRVGELVTKANLPVISAWRLLPESGGFMSYGADIPVMFRRAAVYVDISKHAGRVNDESILVRRDCCVTLQCASVVTNEGIPMYAPEGRT